jgi:predicted MFS family arabinose efflux permease
VTVSLPTRAAAALRPSASPGLLVGVAGIAATFTATPFVIAEVVDEYAVTAGAAALLSTSQMTGFAVGNLAGGRKFVPSRRLARLALTAFVVANGLSAFSPWFSALVGLRLAAGAAMGLITWVAWSDSASDLSRRGEIAAIGPLAAVVASPVIAIAVAVDGLRGMYGVLAIVVALALFAPLEVDATLPTQRHPIAARGVKTILTAMFLFTAGGSSVFVFAKVLATDNAGMSPVWLAIAISANALVGIPGARFAGRRRVPGAWMALTGLCALALTLSTYSWLSFVAMTVWGLAFWVAIPEVYFLLSDRSAHPSDRVGDAQAVMSIGRIAGPSLGGVLVGAGSFTALGWFGVASMALAGFMVQYAASAHRRAPIAVTVRSRRSV